MLRLAIPDALYAGTVLQRLEATAGIAPAYKGFADLCLTTWRRGRVHQSTICGRNRKRRGDGIGRHTGLKIPRAVKRSCGFDPHPRHQMNFLYGNIVTPPVGFAPPQAWPEYGAVSDPPAICRREEVGTPESPGTRWSLWPIVFEEYIGDTEPDLVQSKKGALAYNRIIRWKRILRGDAPRGWRAFSKKTWAVDGFFPLPENGEYLPFWKKNARRDLGIWKKQFSEQTHTIEPITLAEYAEAYRRSIIARKVNQDRLHDLIRKLELPIVQKNTVLWGVKNIQTKEIVAGTAIIHSPTFKSSTHYAPFITPEGAKVYAATALMDHWFAEGVRRKEKFLVTANFWYQGQPKSWKGFSEFKSHFGWQYAAYPPILVRIVGGKFF